MNIRNNNNEHDGNHDDFDRAMRRHYAEALAHVPSNTHARLRQARHAAATGARSPGGSGWTFAGWRLAVWKPASLIAAVFALALGVQFFSSPPATSPAAPQLTETSPVYDAGTAIALLDENPDLYLWLASNDDALPAVPEQ